MSCEQFIEEMSLYIDGLIEEDDKMQFEKHLKSCPNCREELEQFKNIISELHSLPQKELPDNFHKGLLLKLYQKKEGNKVQKKAFYQNWKVLSTMAAAFILFIFVIGSIGDMGLSKNESTIEQSSSGSAPAEVYDMAMDEEAKAKSREYTSDTAAETEEYRVTAELPIQGNNQTIMKAEVNEISDRKIIYESLMSIEVDVFDEAVNKIKDITNKSGGYVENSTSYIYYSEPERNIYLKQGNIKIRIPVEQYGQIQEQITKMGHLIHQEETSTNVTEEYIETESRVRMLEVEQERLLEIMKKAEKVEDLIKLEERLNVVRTDLEIYKSKIKNWDQLVAFSTFSIELKEVKKVEKIKSADPNLQTRLQSSFNKSLNDLREGFERIIVSLAYSIIPFTLLLTFLGTAFLLSRPLLRKILRRIKNWREK